MESNLHICRFNPQVPERKKKKKKTPSLSNASFAIMWFHYPSWKTARHPPSRRNPHLLASISLTFLFFEVVFVIVVEVCSSRPWETSLRVIGTFTVFLGYLKPFFFFFWVVDNLIFLCIYISSVVEKDSFFFFGRRKGEPLFLFLAL